jgi:hypothetical protein
MGQLSEANCLILRRLTTIPTPTAFLYLWSEECLMSSLYTRAIAVA